MHLGDDLPRVFGFLGECEGVGLLAQQRISELEDTEFGHGLAGLGAGAV